MLAVTMLVKDRPRLAEQALRTLRENTSVPWNLVIVDDASGPETVSVLDHFMDEQQHRAVCVSVAEGDAPHGSVGALRNYAALEAAGRGDWLYLSDNDVAFEPGWVEVLLEARRLFPAFKVLGGYNHPYNQPFAFTYPFEFAGKTYTIGECNAVGTASWLLDWPTWDAFGPFAENGRGPNDSSDWAFCQRVRAAGYKCGVVLPMVVRNCGRTSSDGKLCPGADLIADMPGLVVE